MRKRSDRARTYYLSHKEKLAADEAEELIQLLETRKETAKEINQRRQRRQRQMSKQSRVGRMRYLRNKDKLTADEAEELRQRLETLKAPQTLSDLFQTFFKHFF